MSDQSISVASPAVSLPRDKTAFFRLSHKPFKVCLAGGILCIGLFAVFSESKFVSTSDAVVSSYILAVRAPVEGSVTGLPISSGVDVERGQPLGRISNPILDHQHLDDLQTLVEQSQSTADAVAKEQQILSAQRAALVERSNDHIEAVKARLDRELSQAQQELNADQMQSTEAAREADRGRQLFALGIMSRADYEKLAAAEVVAAHQRDAQQSYVEAIKLQSSAASKGILIEPGTDNDVSYSRQRADEISIRLADNERTLATSRLQALQAQKEIAAEAARVQMMGNAALTSPIDAQIWKLNAVNGEHVSAGETVVSLVDCQRQFIIAEIPQTRLPEVAIHQKASFRLSGESKERSGIVLSVSGDSIHQDGASLAALPNEDPKKQLGLVLIGIDKPAQDQTECFVGRNLRVLIPTTSTNMVAQWFRSYF